MLTRTKMAAAAMFLLGSVSGASQNITAWILSG